MQCHLSAPGLCTDHVRARTRQRDGTCRAGPRYRLPCWLTTAVVAAVAESTGEGTDKRKTVLGTLLSRPEQGSSLTLSAVLLSPGPGSGSRTGWAVCAGSPPPPEGGTWGHLSHPVSPALPNTGWGAAQTVWLNEEKVFPRPSQAGDPSPQGGQEAPLAAPGSGAPSPLGQAQQGTETKGTPQQCPGWGMDATTNLRVWASPQGPGKADQTPFTLPLRQGRKEGGVTGRKEAPEPSQGTPLTPALPRHATPCYTHTHARIPRHCSR